METTATDTNNSLETVDSKTQIIATAETSLNTYKKKDFVFTDKRKENLIKANKARKEKEDFKKQLRDKYEAATVELQKLYESKINSFKNNAENTEEDNEMSSAKRVKIAADIPIQAIVKEVQVSQKEIVSETSSDSEVSEKPIQKKRIKHKSSSKKPKKVIYVSEFTQVQNNIDKCLYINKFIILPLVE